MLLLKLTVGNPVKYGLPEPDHQLLESPPIVNNLLPYYVSHQRVSVMGDIERFLGHIARHERIKCLSRVRGCDVANEFLLASVYTRRKVGYYE